MKSIEGMAVKPLAAQPSRRLSDAEIVARAHRSDRNFAILGLSVLVISMIVLLSLIVDFMVDRLIVAPNAQEVAVSEGPGTSTVE